MKIVHLIIILLGLAVSLWLNPVNAHSFNIVFIAPFTESVGQSSMNGFLLATQEQDGHEYEESNGHLGGLDSYIVRVDTMIGEKAVLRQLEITIQKSEPLFAAGLDMNAAIRDMLEKQDVVVVDPTTSGFWASVIADPDQLKMFNGDGFTNAYRQTYKLDPDLPAIRGYLAARVIDAVVRGSSEHARATPRTLEQAVHRIFEKPAL